MEIWKIIPRTNEMYEVSNYGNVRSVDRWVKHKTSGHLVLKGKQLRPLIGIGGYNYVTICINAKRLKKYNHELVCLAFKGERPEGYQIDHIDKNRLNNHVDNLRYITVLANCGMQGSSHPNSLLTETQVIEIRKKYKYKVYTLKMLSKEYGVHETAIGHIMKRRIWKHI